MRLTAANFLVFFALPLIELGEVTYFLFVKDNADAP